MRYGNGSLPRGGAPRGRTGAADADAFGRGAPASAVVAGTTVATPRAELAPTALLTTGAAAGPAAAPDDGPTFGPVRIHHATAGATTRAPTAAITRGTRRGPVGARETERSTGTAVDARSGPAAAWAATPPAAPAPIALISGVWTTG